MTNKDRRITLALSLTLSFVLLFFIATAHAAPILIRFSHVVAEDTPKGIGAKMFKEQVEKRLAGKVQVEIYPMSQKFTDEQAILGLLFGDVEMVAPSFPKFYRFSKAYAVFDQPFFFNSVEEVHNFQDSAIGKQLLSAMEDRGIKGLAYWDNGMRMISTSKPVRVPADLKGQRIRIEPSNVLYHQYSLLGAIPIPMPFNQLRDGLRDGLVDGYENTWSNVYSQDLHHLRSQFTDLSHSYLGYMVTTSAKFWNTLPPEIRSELEEILALVGVEVNRLAEEKARTDKEKILATEKVELIALTEAEKQPWRDALLPVGQDFEATMGSETIAAIRQAKAGK